MLVIINHLNEPPKGPGHGVGDCAACDVNRDNFVSPVDALVLINALNESGAKNLPPSLTADSAELTLLRGAMAVNQGEFRDPGSSRVELAASIGSIVWGETNAGTWEWTMATDEADLGTQSVTITATDETGNSSQIEFDVAIEPAPLKLSPINDQTIGRNYSLGLKVPVVADQSDSLTFSAKVFEAGGVAGAELPVTVSFFNLSVPSNNGEVGEDLSVTATFTDQFPTYLEVLPNGFIGVLTVELTVSDGTASDTKRFALESVQRPPVLKPIRDYLIQPDATLQFEMPFEDQDGDRLEYSVQAFDPLDSSRQPLPVEIGMRGFRLNVDPNGYTGQIAVELQVSDGLAIDTGSFTVESVQIIEPISDRRILQGELLTIEVATSHPHGASLVLDGYASGRIGDGSYGLYFAEFNGNQMTIDFEGAAGEFVVRVSTSDEEKNWFFDRFVVNVKEYDPENAAPKIFIYGHFQKVWQDHRLELPFRASDDYQDEEWLSFSARVVPPADGGAVPEVKFEFSEKETITGNHQFDRVLTVTPPDGYGGSFEVEISASDGLDAGTESYYVTVADQLKYSRQYGNDTYRLDMEGDVYGPGGEIVLDQAVQEFDVNEDGIYYLNWNRDFHLRSGAVPDSDWQHAWDNDFRLHGGINWFTLANDGSLYLFDRDGGNQGQSVFYRGIVSHSDSGEPSLQLSSISPGDSEVGSVQDFAIDDSGSLYVLNGTGDVRRFSNGQWQYISGSVESFEVQNDGTIYYLSEAGALRTWKNGLARTVAQDVKQFELDADQILYRLDTNGWLSSIDTKSADPAAGDSSWDLLGKNIVVLQRRSYGYVSFLDGKPEDPYANSFRNGQLKVGYGDGTSATTFSWGDLNSFIAQAQSEDASNAVPPPVNGRGIIGGTLPSSYLDNQFGQSASKAILGAVARINTTVNGEQFVGSGTLLEWGGNRYVLTAAHVVEDANGSPVNASQVTVDLPELGPGGAGLRVERILGREQFTWLDSANPKAGLDLALLRLSSRVDSRIQGGILSENGAVPASVLVAGYGTDNSGNSGSFNFGYTVLDKLGQRSAGNLTTGHATTGLHIVNRWNGSEASFASGDSGGPAFEVKRLNSSSSTPRWAPVIVAVHSFGKDPNENDQFDIGEEKWSLQMTPAVAGRIKQLISAEVGGPRLVADFKVRVINDGDGSFAGQGEWAMTLIVNGTAIANAQRLDVSDGPFHHPVASTTVTPGSALQVQFYGYESDANELFTGDDDVIPLLTKTLTAPSERERSILADAELVHSLGTRSGDTEYELLVYFRNAWS